MSTERAAWTSRRWRWRPRSIASGAGAGPNTAIFSTRGAARPIARAASVASARSSDETTIAASRPKGGIAASRRAFGLGGVEALAVAADQGLDHRRRRLVGLDQHPARLLAAPGAAGDLGDLLEAALGGAQIAARQAEIGVDHADQGEVGEMIALGDELGADDDVDLARLHPPDELGRLGRRPDRVRGDDRGARVGEQGRDLVGDPLDAGPDRRPGSLPRRIPGRRAGGGMIWPQWWQASRRTSRCSTIQAVQFGHWKRWPQWRHKVSGA